MRKRILQTIGIHILMAICASAILYSLHSVFTHGVSGVKGTKVYYDAKHGSRHLWNRDNRRHRVAYHTVSGFNRFYEALREEGFDVHVETYKKFNRKTLDKYDVFFIGEQTYHANFITERENKDLLDWVKDGGGLFTIIEHTDAHYMAEAYNRLYKELPVKARRDGICDLNQPPPISPSWVDLTSDENHPVNKGVREFRFYNGASLDTKHGVLFSMKTSWSDRYDPESRPIHNGNKRRDPDELAGPLVGAAAFNYGKGRVVTIADHNAMSNPTMYWGDHYRFVMNSMKWLAGNRLNTDIWMGVAAILVLGAGAFWRKKILHISSTTKKSVVVTMGTVVLLSIVLQLLQPPEYDFFVHTGNDSSMKYMTKRKNGYFSVYGQWTKEPQLKPWASKTLKPGYDALFLSAPRKKYTEEQLGVVKGYLSRDKTVVYLATIDSLSSPAGDQLKSEFDFDVTIADEPASQKGRRPFIVHGPRDWTESIFRFYIDHKKKGVTVKRGIEPIVYLTKGNYHINEHGWKNTRHLFDILSQKKIGGGTLWLVAPMELFTDEHLKNLYQDADVVRQQMAEFIIRLGKFASGDHSKYYIN